MIKKALIAVLMLAVLGFVASYVMESYVRHDWSKKHYGNMTSTEPFGAYYLKQHLEETWKGGAETDTTLIGAMQKRKGKPCNYIVYSAQYSYVDIYDKEALLNAILRGSNIIIVGSNSDMLSMFHVNDYTEFDFDIKYVSNRSSHYERKGLLLNNKDASCSAWSFLLEKTFEISPYLDDLDDELNVEGRVNSTRSVLKDTGGQTYVMQRKMNKGSITFAGYEALFSNYAVSDNATCKLMDDVLGSVLDKNKPVVLVSCVAEMEEMEYAGNGNLDPTYQVMLNHEGSALAIYILLAALVLLLIVNGRRRRAAMKQEQLERNSTISFIKHLATLYTLRSDYTELLRIEQRSLLYRLRKEYRFDYTTKDFTKPSDYASHIARSKELDVNKIREALQLMERLTSTTGNLSRKQYIDCLKMVERVV